jgi:hypothetical protein
MRLLLALLLTAAAYGQVGKIESTADALLSRRLAGPVQVTSPTSGQVLSFNGATWVSAAGVGTDQAFDSILLDIANEDVSIFRESAGLAAIGAGGTSDSDGAIALNELYFTNGTDSIRLDVKSSDADYLQVLSGAGSDTATIDAAIVNAGGSLTIGSDRGKWQQSSLQLYSGCNLTFGDTALGGTASIRGNRITLTNGVATDCGTLTISSGRTAGVKLDYVVNCRNGDTEHQSMTGTVSFHGVNQSTVMTLAAPVDIQNAPVGDGTLTVVWTIVQNASTSSAEVFCEATSSLSDTVFNVTIVAHGGGGANSGWSG